MEFFRFHAESVALLADGGEWLFDLPIETWSPGTRALLWLWIAILGACVGSFLNVVIYRLPRGISLLRPGSHCPACQHPIRARDNLPILGWLLLRGRCRDCGAAISSRYPLIEALVAVLFVGLAMLYLGTSGATLPTRLNPTTDAIVWTERRLTALCGFQLLLIVYVLAAAGMRWDGQRVGRWLSLGLAVIGFLAPCLWPWLRPFPSGLTLHAPLWFEGLVSGIAGAAIGWFVGFLRSGRASQVNLLYVVVGLILGWQSVLIVATVAGVVAASLAFLKFGQSLARRVTDEVTVLVAIVVLPAAGTALASFSQGNAGWLLLAGGLLSIFAASEAERRMLVLCPPDSR